MKRFLTLLLIGATLATVPATSARAQRGGGGFNFDFDFGFQLDPGDLFQFINQDPASGIDPVIVRLNGVDAVTQDVIPWLVEEEGLGHFEEGPIGLLNTQANMGINFGTQFGPLFAWMGTWTASATFESSLTGVEIDIPVDSDSITATFRNGDAPDGRVRVDIDIPNATLDTTLRVRTRLRVGLPNWIPAELRVAVLNLVNITDDFDINVTGVAIQMRAVLEQTEDGILIERLERFRPQVDSVSISDSIGLVALADAFAVAIDQVFDVPGAGSVNEAATTLTNEILRDNPDLEDMFVDSVNVALSAQAEVQGFEGSLPNFDVIPLDITYAFSSFRTRNNALTTNWDVSIEGDGNALPELAYSYLSRPTEDVDSVSENGDLQAFLPLSLFDKAVYELAQEGLFTVPMSFPATRLSPAFNLQLSVFDVPRATAGGSNEVVLTLPVSLNSTGKTSPEALQFNNVEATLEVTVGVHVDDRNGLALSIEDVNLAELTGSIRLLGRFKVEASRLAFFFEPSIVASLIDQLPALTLVPKVTSIMPPFSVSIGDVTVGSRYVNVPLTLITD